MEGWKRHEEERKDEVMKEGRRRDEEVRKEG